MTLMLLPGTGDEKPIVYRPLAAYISIKVEPAGKRYHELCVEAYHKARDSSWSLQPQEEEDNESDDEGILPEEETPEGLAYLKSLDAKEWKEQDHYAVLGLEKLRFEASEKLIKSAYRRKVLWHHPDKRKNRGENIKDLDHDYFVCITKAYEILSNPLKRRSYDSVDPMVDDSIPPVNAHSKSNFFKVFGPVFARNARWSVKQPTPDLGNENSSFEEVDNFYSFWYDFDSWREFSYKDEEEKDKADSRDERRWIEKQNKVARQKLKKEEMARIRSLVDNAYACDPRIQSFKEAERQKKLAQKKARQEAAKAKLEEEIRQKREAEEAEKLAKQKEEEEAKAQKEQAKREKEAYKKDLKKARKELQTLCQQNNFFAQNEAEKISHMAEVDKLCHQLSLVKLQSLNKVIENSSSNNARDTFIKEIKSIKEQLQKESMAEMNHNLSSHRNEANNKDSKSSSPWTPADIQLLIKAVNLFPAGTANRWQVVAEFMNQHSGSSPQRQAKDVLSKTKELQKLDSTLKEEVNQRAFENLEKSQKVNTIKQAIKDDSTPSQRFDDVNSPQPWSAEEQKLLEQALKTYPTSTPERWDRIAECVPGRTKKDCMLRYKELVEMVKAKKAAQKAAGISTK